MRGKKSAFIAHTWGFTENITRIHRITRRPFQTSALESHP